MATYNLGRVGLNPRGAYNSTTTYSKLDVVTYNGSSYVSLTGSTGSAPTDTTNWALLANGLNPNKAIARSSIGILSGTSLPDASSYASGDIFVLYE